MKKVITTVAVAVAGLAFAAGSAIGGSLPDSLVRASRDAVARIAPKKISSHAPSTVPSKVGARGVSTDALNGVVKQYCSKCHSADSTSPPGTPSLRKGNLTLVGFDMNQTPQHTDIAELMVRKLRANMMPPPKAARPGGDTLTALVETIEQTVDKAAKPYAGVRTFQRMNRPEYTAAIRDLLGLDVDASKWLPLDQLSANFDNIGDVQSISATLLQSYMSAASDISRMAVGERNAPPAAVKYRSSPYSSQFPWEHVDGAPIGTRGGLVVTHTFQADGLYSFAVDVQAGQGSRLEDIDVSIDNQRIPGTPGGLLHYERGLESSTSIQTEKGDYVRTEPVPITAGQHKVSVSFVRRTEGTYEDLIKTNLWSGAGNGAATAGITEAARIRSFLISGPTKITGISENPTRKLIFSCKPTSTAQERPCAQTILGQLGRNAFRRSLTQPEMATSMGLYDKGAANGGGFEEGVRLALEGILASPRFYFRIEEPAGARVQPGQDYQISDNDLASRLSFFIWGSIPDDELLSLASEHKLSDKKTLEKEVKRMMADPRAPLALAERFGAQWLRLQDLDKNHPDAFFFPDYSERTALLMRRETMEFFADLVRGDHSMFDLYTAKYTFLNEQLANYYKIPGVAGDYFRKVDYPDSTRRGILGQGSYLVQTSFANRTSPVLRGKWVMQVLIGAPPPPPPPDVPALDATAGSKNGKVLTTRERVEQHRAYATCSACHQYMDPLGLASDNFDLTGRWRAQENLQPVDTHGTMYDGTPLSGISELANALVKRPIPLMRTLTENLMAYAVGRRMEDEDQPTIRAIVKQAEASNNRFSSFVMGVVNSREFRYRQAEPVTNSAMDSKK